MKRPAGLVIAAVLLILGSLLALCATVLMVLAGVLAPHLPASPSQTVPQPSWISAVMFVIAGFGALVAAWGIVTAIGVLRFRTWARYSILVIGGCVAVYSLIAALSSSIFLFVPLPLPPSTDPSQLPGAQMMMKVIFGSMVLSYLIAAAIGVWWLFYFNSRNLRSLFAQALPAQAQLEIRPNPRPFLISILAVLNLAGAVICCIYALLPIPAMILGFALHGWGKAAVYLLFAAASGAIGWGLWRLQEWGRRLALGMLAFGAINTIVYVVRPSLMADYTAEINRSMGIAANPLSPAFQSAMLAFSLCLSVLFLIAFAVVLIRYRSAFRSSGAVAV